MLKRVVKWVLNNNQTVFVIPISLGYDRIVESDSHLEVISGGVGWKEGGSWVRGGREGEGEEAKKFAMGMTSMGKTASLIMNVTCFGRVDLCIASPIDLKTFLGDCLGSLYGTGEPGGKFEGMTKKGMVKYLAMSVGYQALYLCNKVSKESVPNHPPLFFSHSNCLSAGFYCRTSCSCCDCPPLSNEAWD